MVQWVVLDLGETLVDETRAWDGWASWLGVPRLTFMGVFGATIAERRPHTDVLGVFAPERDWRDEVERKTAAGFAWEVDERDLYPDALPTLERLRADGYRVAVMANQPAVAEHLLARLPLDAYGTSATWGVSKPDPAFFTLIAAEVGASPEEIAYVGDRIDNDVLPAKAAGMTAIHIRRGPWGHIHATWPEACEAHARIDTLNDLHDALARLS